MSDLRADPRAEIALSPTQTSSFEIASYERQQLQTQLAAAHEEIARLTARVEWVTQHGDAVFERAEKAEAEVARLTQEKDELQATLDDIGRYEY